MDKPSLNIHENLIERCRANDAQAQYEIYRLYAKSMLNTAFRIVGTEVDAEDVLQESFVSAFKNIESYRADATFGAWLKRIVVNKALTYLQKMKRQLFFSEVDEEPIVEVETVNEAHLEMDVSKIKEAVMDLPDGFRSVLTLYLFEGYDHKEISEILNISESTSKTQYKRAKDKLKEKLKSDMNYG